MLRDEAVGNLVTLVRSGLRWLPKKEEKQPCKLILH